MLFSEMAHFHPEISSTYKYKMLKNDKGVQQNLIVSTIEVDMMVQDDCADNAESIMEEDSRMRTFKITIR